MVRQTSILPFLETPKTSLIPAMDCFYSYLTTQCSWSQACSSCPSSQKLLLFLIFNCFKSDCRQATSVTKWALDHRWDRDACAHEMGSPWWELIHFRQRRGQKWRGSCIILGRTGPERDLPFPAVTVLTRRWHYESLAVFCGP